MEMTHSYMKNFSITLICCLIGALGVKGQDVPTKQQTESTTSTSKESPSASGSSTGAFSVITGEELMVNYFGSINNALNGKLSGLVVTEGFGEPGSDGGSMSIRGYGNLDNRNVKIYVDGFEADHTFLESLAPSEIETITILKDGAALASYGMKGSNGILLVKTKRGEAGKTKIDFNLKTGTQQVTGIYKPLRSYDFASLYNEAVSNDNGMEWSPVYSTQQLQAYQNGTGTDVDWYDETLKDMGTYTNANLTFKGGDQNARFFTNFGFLNNTGIYDVPTNDEMSNALQNKYNVRLNLDFKMLRIFEGQVDVGGIVDDRKSPVGTEGSLWNAMANYPSNIYPVKNPNGSWTGSTIYPNNPVATTNALGYNSTHDRTLQGRFMLRENLDNLTKGLYLEESVYFNTWTRGTYNRTRNYERVINGVVQTPDLNTNFVIFDDNGTNQWNTKQFNARLGYSRTFDNDIVSGAVTYRVQNINVDANQNGPAGLQNDYNFENIGGFVNYSKSNKYAAEFGFAYSGSDNYAKGNRWGFYPTLSASWDVSKEDFLKDNDVVNSLRLRASVGKTGNDESVGQRYLFMKYYSGTQTFNTGNTSIVGNGGSILLNTPNEDIFAEQSLKYNFGVDAKIVNHLTLTLDAFLDKRSGIVTIENTYSAVFGAIPPYLNVGEVTTKGIESMLNFSNKIGDFAYSVTAMALFTNNTIDYAAEIPMYQNARITGNPIGSRFGFEAIGFYDVSDFNADGSLKDGIPVPTFGVVQPGDIKYKDIFEDDLIDDADRVKIGAPYFPTTTYSLNIDLKYKGFDAKVLFQGVSGREISLLDVRNLSIPFADNSNAYPLIKDRWAYYPEQGIDTRATAKYPRLSATTNTNNYVGSTFWQKNADYLKLRNIEIGYSLPESLAQKVSLSSIRIYFNAHNLLSFSSLEDEYGIDPESISGYPAMKSITMGININL
jgi:TonB-linked SusC/RagA family outer membrane protein